jgi:hypothetical protein
MAGLKEFWQIVTSCFLLSSVTDSLTDSNLTSPKKPFIHQGIRNLTTDGHGFLILKLRLRKNRTTKLLGEPNQK